MRRRHARGRGVRLARTYRCGGERVGGHIEQPQRGLSKVGSFDAEVAVLGLPLLDTVGLALLRRVGNTRPFRRPPEDVDTLLGIRESARFAAVGPDEIDLLLLTPVGEEGDPVAVRGPPRGATASRGGAGELEWCRALAGQPDLGVVAIVLPVRGPNRERDRTPVRRESDGAEGAKGQHVFERWPGPRRLGDAQYRQQQGGDGRGGDSHGRQVPCATAGTKVSNPWGGNVSVLPCSAL